jgi:uncharacterized membrane protein
VDLANLARRVFRWNLDFTLGRRTFRIYLFCHGIPERSFRVSGRALPVCSRCTGVIAGSLAFVPAILILPRDAWLIVISVLLTMPLVIDGMTQASGKRSSNNRIRFITGLLAGIGIALMAISL